MAAIFFVSGQSQPSVPGGISNTTGHLIAYAGLGLLLVRAITGRLGGRITGRAAGTALAIATAYGVTDEVHQMFVPGRMPDIGDVAADAAGAFIAVGVCWAWGIIRAPNPG
jgi:VanZ family protein